MSVNFNLNTDHDTDKIIYLETATATIDASGATLVTLGSGKAVSYNGFGDAFFDHSLPYRPLLLYTWSTTSDFSVSNTHESFFESLNTSIHTRDDTSITLSGTRAAGPINVYFRIYGIQRPGAVGDLTPPDEGLYLNHFKYNTDLNYMKIFTEGVAPSLASGSSVSIPHSLGYRPRVLTWEKNTSTGFEFYHNAGITDLVAGSIRTSVQPTTTDVIITNPSGSLTTSDITYKIYLDD